MERKVREELAPVENNWMDTFSYTHNMAIDIVAVCIGTYKKQGKKPKEIILRRDYYECFVEYVEKTDEVKLDTKLVFDGVEILPGPKMEDGEYFLMDPLKVNF